MNVGKTDKKKKLVDYTCKGANEAGFSEKLISDFQLEFPKSYHDCKIMARISQYIKN
ncbi:hypothetical protein [Dehalobacterium formicoaceticum]|uniref:hypothetical protein n=1 Tax=Dehalobacterium formicoaceticum TaxID=51515 RepID=UPI0031F6F610